ncbi:MAG: hypothetical protein IJC25_02110 [Clostridia bacterium]|nr:hypothetical protein [Clostridia bacterium]
MAPIRDHALPENLFVCVPDTDRLLLKAGDCARMGSVITRNPIDHSAYYVPADGVVQSISPYRHPQMGSCMMVHIDTTAPIDENTPALAVSSESTLERLKGLIDRLDGRSLVSKLLKYKQRGIKVLAVNAVDDQPYVCPSAGLIKHRRDDIVRGLEILRGLCGAQTTQVFLYGSRSFAFYDLTQRRRESTGNTIFIGAKYPARQMLSESAGKEYGFVGAQTCLDVLEMLETGRGQTHTVISVGGSLIGEPVNLRVPIGAPVGEILDACRPSDEPGTVILGGPMTGKYLRDTSTPVGLLTEAVLFIRPSVINASANCWGCANCVSVCPRGLMPLYIARFAKHERYQDALDLGAASCIECGCCSYVCSGSVDPMTFIVKAKRYAEISVTDQPSTPRPMTAPTLSDEFENRLIPSNEKFPPEVQQ